MSLNYVSIYHRRSPSADIFPVGDHDAAHVCFAGLCMRLRQLDLSVPPKAQDDARRTSAGIRTAYCTPQQPTTIINPVPKSLLPNADRDEGVTRRHGVAANEPAALTRYQVVCRESRGVSCNQDTRSALGPKAVSSRSR